MMGIIHAGLKPDFKSKNLFYELPNFQARNEN